MRLFSSDLLPVFDEAEVSVFGHLFKTMGRSDDRFIRHFNSATCIKALYQIGVTEMNQNSGVGSSLRSLYSRLKAIDARNIHAMPDGPRLFALTVDNPLTGLLPIFVGLEILDLKYVIYLYNNLGSGDMTIGVNSIMLPNGTQFSSDTQARDIINLYLFYRQDRLRSADPKYQGNAIKIIKEFDINESSHYTEEMVKSLSKHLERPNATINDLLLMAVDLKPEVMQASVVEMTDALGLLQQRSLQLNPLAIC